jgi:2-polyprenyl-3-methyl-5-hydroxy-6-metoxy-1,4-benzoquinol methylase
VAAAAILVLFRKSKHLRGKSASCALFCAAITKRETEMIPPAQLGLLISPDNGQPLELSQGQLRAQGGGPRYAIEGKLPILLPQQAREAFRHAEQHERFGSRFFYVDHYQVDAEFFDYFEDFEDGASRHEMRRLHETIISEVPRQAASILDVGCGKAWVAEHFCPRGVAVHSMDISTVNPQRALERYPYDNHYGVVADAYRLPFRPGSFDCIIACEIIEHVPDPAEFMASLMQVLKPGGQLIITTPYNERIQHSLCVHCNRPTPHHAHLHSFTLKKMLALAPLEMAARHRSYAFGSKALIKLKTHLLLKYLPFPLWRLLDRMANGLVRLPSRILFKLEKH